jgi:hypothetical protein
LTSTHQFDVVMVTGAVYAVMFDAGMAMFEVSIIMVLLGSPW